MAEAGKTSTFTIHHDRCDPTKWTLAQWKLLQDFMCEPILQRAGALSRLGVQLVLSEHHEPRGGELECAGWADAEDCDFVQELDDFNDDYEILEIAQMFRGHTKYAVRYGIGHDDMVEGHETEVFDTRDEADVFLKSLLDVAQSENA